MKKIKIGGIIQSKQLAQVGVMSLPDHPGLAGKVLETIGKEAINVQFIVESVDQYGRSNIFFCVDQKDLEDILRILQQLQPTVGHLKVVHQAPVGIISVFGPHFRERPAIAGTMFTALGKAGINIMAISTSISTLSCVIEEGLLPEAVKAISEAFELP